MNLYNLITKNPKYSFIIITLLGVLLILAVSLLVGGGYKYRQQINRQSNEHCSCLACEKTVVTADNFFIRGNITAGLCKTCAGNKVREIFASQNNPTA